MQKSRPDKDVFLLKCGMLNFDQKNLNKIAQKNYSYYYPNNEIGI